MTVSLSFFFFCVSGVYLFLLQHSYWHISSSSSFTVRQEQPAHLASIPYYYYYYSADISLFFLRYMYYIYIKREKERIRTKAD